MVFLVVVQLVSGVEIPSSSLIPVVGIHLL